MSEIKEKPEKPEKMPQEEKDLWKGRIESSKKYMEKRHELWKELHAEYNLKFSVPGLDDEHIVKLSRMYPLVRQIIASISFHYPHIFIAAKPLAENNRKEMTIASDIMERSANASIEIMDVKSELHQGLFDSLFCGVGWLKMGFNPQGDDAVPPYVANDAFEEDFPYVMRVNPFNVFVDPLCPPHKLAYASYIIERMWVPLEFLKEDDRYNQTVVAQIKTGSEAPEEDSLLDIGTDSGPDEQEAIKNSRSDGNMVLLYEIHDRIHRKIITFAEGVAEPLENTDHPFRKAQPVKIEDPSTGEQITTGFAPTQGFLMKGGFSYIPIKFDTDGSSFYPLPPMAFIQDLQKVVIESVSRRLDQLQRFKRLVWMSKSELEQNKTLRVDLKNAQDGDVIGLIDLNSVKEANWGSVSSDQLGIESDARGYEENSLHVSDLAGSAGRKTATESALLAGQSSINREWMQEKVSAVYSTIIRNCFRLFRDERFMPKRHIIELAEDIQVESYAQVLTSDDFKWEFDLTIDAQSMQPMIEELQRDDTILLFDRLNGNPLVDQTEIVKDLMRAFRVRNPERKLAGLDAVDSRRLAEIENVVFILAGQDPGVVEGMDHAIHAEVHNPENIMQMQEFQQIEPDQQQQIIELAQAHAEEHLGAMSDEAIGSQTGSQPAVDGRLLQGEKGVESEVRSSAQNISEAATADIGKLARQGV